MNLKLYMNMSKDDLAFALKAMPPHKLKMFYAAIAADEARTRHAIVPTILPAFMIAGGKIVEPNKQTMACRGSVCRAPHKNQR
jgi:hypothetical protein